MQTYTVIASIETSTGTIIRPAAITTDADGIQAAKASLAGYAQTGETITYQVF